jgi:hypothetical protein
MRLERPGAARSDAGRNDGLLELGIRQTNDDSDILPVRLYGPKVGAVADALTLGAPLYVKGSVEVRVKNIGEPDPATGLYRTAKFPFIRTSVLRGAQPGEHIKIGTPGWAVALQEEESSKRAQRQRRRMREEEQPGAVTELASGTAPSQSATGMVDPALLARLREVAPTAGT